MMYLVYSQRSSRLPVENPSGISEEESFRYQPLLRSEEIVVSLGQDHAAGSERGDSNQRSLHNCGMVGSNIGADVRDCGLSASFLLSSRIVRMALCPGAPLCKVSN